MLEFTYSQVESLNETETYVYNYVVKNTKKVLNESIRELANNTHVSTATVMRFCKKMGCDGFTELKYRLKENVEVQETKKADVSDQFDDFIEKVKSSDYLDSIQRAANIIRDSDSFAVLGIGIHSDFAKHAACSFCRSGYYCYGIDNTYYPIPELSEGESSVVMIIHEKSQEKTLFSIVNHYKSKKYKTIMIASEDIGVMERLCDHVVYVSEGFVKMGQIISGVPLLYAVERIIEALTK